MTPSAHKGMDKPNSNRRKVRKDLFSNLFVFMMMPSMQRSDHVAHQCTGAFRIAAGTV